MKTAISNVAPGQVVKFHGEPCIVLEHRTAGTLLVTAAQIKSSFGSTNNFAVSSFREHLNGAFADALTEGHADELITREVDLTALNGSKEYGSCECKVAPLTFDEIRRFHGLLPKPESWEWSATPWSTPCVDEDDTWVMGLGTNGYVNYDHCTLTYGSRPAFTLPSTLSVSDDGTVSVNTAPTITSSTANGSNLGTKTAGFNFQYTVNDVDGDTVTVKEYLDNVLKRTYTATLGQVNTFQAVTAANWQKILNGSHTLKVVASDGKADSAAYTVTFAKKVTKATVTLAAPLAADDAISVMVMNIVGTLPADAVMEVLVTNNAKDTTPVWEDATADVKNGANHVFTNKTAANGFAFNFKLSVERGASDTGGYISNIGGAFE